MSGFFRLFLVVSVVWIGAYAALYWQDLKYLQLPDGEPGWLCEYPIGSGIGDDAVPLLSNEDIDACLARDPAGFTHDHYFDFIESKKKVAYERVAAGLALPAGLIFLTVVVAWVASGFRTRPAH